MTELRTKRVLESTEAAPLNQRDKPFPSSHERRQSVLPVIQLRHSTHSSLHPTCSHTSVRSLVLLPLPKHRSFLLYCLSVGVLKSQRWDKH